MVHVAAQKVMDSSTTIPDVPPLFPVIFVICFGWFGSLCVPTLCGIGLGKHELLSGLHFLEEIRLIFTAGIHLIHG
jgi:hypothetical protein